MENVLKKSSVATVAIVTLGTFMSSFDISVVNMALPIMQSHFHATIASIEWVIVAYLLVLSATQLTFGRLADMFGYKKIYIAGFALFTVSSLSCALAPSLAVLITFRIFQAISASMMTSSSSPIIVNTVEPENRGKSLGMLAVAVAVSTCLGPTLGGLLASTVGWSSIFFINVPIGVIGTLLAIKIIHSDAKTASKSHFDPIGSVLIFAALFLILLPLNLFSRSVSISATIVLTFAVGIAALIGFLIVESKVEHPLLNLSLFHNRIFTASNFSAMFFYLAEFIMVFASPYYFQKLHGFSGVQSGLMMMPMSLAMMASAPISGAISDRFGSRSISCIGLGIMTAGLLLFSTFDVSTPTIVILFSMFLVGFGGGFFQTPNTNAVMSNVPANRRGVASATLGTMRNLGMVSGEAIAGTIICAVMSSFAVIAASKGLTGNACFSFEFAPAVKFLSLTAAICSVFALILSLLRGNTKANS
jgi:EmrB/QacA subfamily drug resistance transporter